MSRTFVSLAFIVTLFLCFHPSAGGAGTPADQGPAPSLVRLAEGVYAFLGAGGGANSGFVVTEEGVIVIDSQGPKGIAMLFREKVREITDKPVIYVINTHYHGDHTFGNQYFKEARAIIAHEETGRELLESDKAHRERFKKFFGEESLVGFNLTPPTVVFTGTLTIRSGSRILKLIHPGTPAHTRGDICVYLPGEKVIFAGDILYKERLPWLADGDSSGALKAVEGILGLDAVTFVPGHGGVATKEEAGEYRTYLIDLRDEVQRLVASGKTLEEVKREIRLPRYDKYAKYAEWLPLNAEKVYTELKGGAK